MCLPQTIIQSNQVEFSMQSWSVKERFTSSRFSHHLATILPKDITLFTQLSINGIRWYSLFWINTSRSEFKLLKAQHITWFCVMAATEHVLSFGNSNQLLYIGRATLTRTIATNAKPWTLADILNTHP